MERSDRSCSASRFSIRNSRSTAKALWWQAKLIFSTRVAWILIFDVSWSAMAVPSQPNIIEHQLTAFCAGGVNPGFCQNDYMSP
ncbi:hypothetical protein MA04_03835 [Alcanivorax balearicus MACL04]|uniref:Uncharacterized protein n=1 Tax=Alloalcanivorax balearicus MACL04 TaxID=1177182 RepID=A0ABT2R428_9GAMM|nr:hypothetical protein [Alloalcanivorax balearicus MACL04]